MTKVVCPIMSVVFGMIVGACSCSAYGQLVVAPVEKPVITVVDKELSKSKVVEVQGATLTARTIVAIEREETKKEQPKGLLQEVKITKTITTNDVESVRTFPLMFERRSVHVLKKAIENKPILEKGKAKP